MGIFKQGMRTLNQGYGHKDTHVMLASWPLPTGGSYTNTQPYEARGWCFTEQVMSSLTKSSKGLIDLSRVNSFEYFTALLRSGMGRSGHVRAAPLAPAKFAEQLKMGVEMGKIKFTKGADVEVVTKIYATAVDTEFAFEQDGDLWYDGLGWGDKELEELADVLTVVTQRGGCRKLRTIRLNKLDGLKGQAETNCITDAGCAFLAKALRDGACPGLVQVELDDHEVTMKGVKMLEDARPGLKVR